MKIFGVSIRSHVRPATPFACEAATATELSAKYQLMQVLGLSKATQFCDTTEEVVALDDALVVLHAATSVRLLSDHVLQGVAASTCCAVEWG